MVNTILVTNSIGDVFVIFGFFIIVLEFIDYHIWRGPNHLHLGLKHEPHQQVLDKGIRKVRREDEHGGYLSAEY